MEMCLIFTGLEPCAEHTYWCGPKFAITFGFTGRISTPSLLKIWSYIEEKPILPLQRHASSPAPGNRANEKDLPLPPQEAKTASWGPRFNHPTDEDLSAGAPV
jgi:hypothetical protein